MHQSVHENWHAFSQPFEGRLLTMYLDVKGLVTTGVGNLIDPVSEAIKLPWKHKDGRPATSTEISAAWHALKARPDLAHRNARLAAALTGLELSDADVDALMESRLNSNEAFITAHHFPFFPEFPADAQLGILSMAWAVGADFAREFKNFKAAVLAGDWLAARDACKIREEGNSGVVPRNAANRVCFANAEIVTRCGLARDVLRWPNVAQADVHPSDRAANLGTLVGIALDDAREHALEVNRLERSRDMAEIQDDEPTNPIGGGVA